MGVALTATLSVSIPKPRSKDTRWVEADEMHIGEFEHEWLRCAAYKQGHVLSQDGETALCGHPLYVTPHGWDSLRAHLQARTGVDIDEWWVAVDTRKGDKCTRCKKLLKDGRDPFKKSDQAKAYDKSQPVSEGEEDRPQPVTLTEGSAAERLARVRSDALVGRVARALGAEVVA